VDNATFDISGLTNGGTSITTLSGTGGVTLGANTLTLSNASSTFGGVISGTGGFSLTGGTERLTGANTYTGATNVNAGKLVFAANHTSSSALAVQSGADAELAAGNSRIIKTASLTVNGTGQLNLNDNKLITQSAIGSFAGSAYTGVTGLIQSGRNGGNWNGGGIVTSQSAAIGSNFTTLAVARGSEVKANTVSETALWAGQTITGTDTLVMYTYGGDANLDGKLNIDDYVRIDKGIAGGLTGWSNGDFNYDGKVNIDDYSTIIDVNIGNQNGVFPTASGVAAVPEPITSALLILPAAALVLRRSRRRGQVR
jgi:autotransporter-associated beta strand protein